jgi:hypothetical protein
MKKLFIILAVLLVSACVSFGADSYLSTNVATLSYTNTSTLPLVLTGGKSAQAYWIFNSSATTGDIWLSPVTNVANASSLTASGASPFKIAAGGSLTFPTSSLPFKPNQLYCVATNAAGTANLIIIKIGQ